MLHRLVLLWIAVAPTSAFSPAAGRQQPKQQQKSSSSSSRRHDDSRRSSAFSLLAAQNKNGWIDPCAPVNSVESLKKTAQKALEGSKFCKRLSLLGSTGSIGTQTLEIVDACPDNFVVDALSAGTNAKLMAEQVIKYRPKLVSMSTAQAANELKTLLKQKGSGLDYEMPDIVYGDEGTVLAATVASADTVVTGIVGAAGLLPTIEAIKLGKDIALANKETLISGGPVINPLVEKHGVNMVRTYILLMVDEDCVARTIAMLI
jgi:1-deoxy-D-xylulose 5-phosphate reductoisomerase